MIEMWIDWPIHELYQQAGLEGLLVKSHQALHSAASVEEETGYSLTVPCIHVPDILCFQIAMIRPGKIFVDCMGLQHSSLESPRRRQLRNAYNILHWCLVCIGSFSGWNSLNG